MWLSVVALLDGPGSSLSSFLLRRTASPAAAVLAPALVLANPNVLYLQSTPMTEPLFLGLVASRVAFVDRWIVYGTPRARHQAGAAIFALALTRYEGWLVAAALVVASVLARRRDGVRPALGLVPYLAAAGSGFLLLGWATTGVWFVTSGFFEHDPATYHDTWADDPSGLSVHAGTWGASVSGGRGRVRHRSGAAGDRHAAPRERRSC